jgi:molybdate transport system substrate-binding protein
MTAPLKMLSSMATRELLAELAASYEQQHGIVVEARAGGGVDVAKRIAAGEPCDVVVLASNAIDKLVADGAVLAPRKDLVRSGVAIAVHASADMLPVATAAQVKAAVLAAPSISYSTGPSGVYLEKLFKHWEILDEIRPRIVVPPPSVPVGTLVADGRAALGFQQLSELMNLAGIKVLGPLPDEIQTMTVFSGGVCTSTGQHEAARALLGFLASPAVAATKRRHGMEPAT